MSTRLYLSMYTGSFAQPDSETIVTTVPLKLAKTLPLVYAGNILSWAYLHRVYVRAGLRRAGRGGEILRATLKATDALGLSLVLRCAPFDDMKGNKKKLREFYMKHGFRTLLPGQSDILIRRV